MMAPKEQLLTEELKSMYVKKYVDSFRSYLVRNVPDEIECQFCRSTFDAPEYCNSCRGTDREILPWSEIE